MTPWYLWRKGENRWLHSHYFSFLLGDAKHNCLRRKWHSAVCHSDAWEQQQFTIRKYVLTQQLSLLRYWSWIRSSCAIYSNFYSVCYQSKFSVFLFSSWLSARGICGTGKSSRTTILLSVTCRLLLAFNIKDKIYFCQVFKEKILLPEESIMMSLQTNSNSRLVKWISLPEIQ